MGRMESVLAIMDHQAQFVMGKSIFLQVESKGMDVKPIASAIEEDAAFKDYLLLSYEKETQGEDEIIAQIIPQIQQKEGLKAGSDALLVKQDGKRYVLELSLKDVSTAVQATVSFLQSIASGTAEPFVRSAERAAGDLEPLLPGCMRATAVNFKSLVLEPGYDVFLQEFADWCPWCVIMHQYTNNLAWVMKDVKDVRVCKIDTSLNDTEEFEPWLQSCGIPNILFLPNDQKQKPQCHPKLEFGAAGEGNEMDLRVDAMVAFIHRHMTGEKFDESTYKRRAKLIQGQEGFLSGRASGESGDRTWIEVLNGPEMGEGPKRTFKGCPSSKEDHLAEDWRRALSAASMNDENNMDRDPVSAVELVLTKLKHQLGRERMKDNEYIRILDEAACVVETAKKNLKYFVPCGERRQVEFQIRDVRVQAINTVAFNFQVSFTMDMEWRLKMGDLAQINKENNNYTGWKPPYPVIRNAEEEVMLQQQMEDSEVTRVFRKDGGLCGKQTISVKCSCQETFELQNFPFDTQPLSIILNWKADPELWSLHAPTVGSAVCYSPLQDLAEWYMLPPLCEIFYQNYGFACTSVALDKEGLVSASDQRKRDLRPALIVKVIAKRGWSQFIWTTVYIVALLGVMGNAAFLAHPIDDFCDRVAIILACFLSVCVFQGLVDSQLPKLKYISSMQMYMILMNLLLTAIFAEICAVKLWELEADMLFLQINIAVWLLIQGAFAIYVSCITLPAERRRMFEMTPVSELQGTRRKYRGREVPLAYKRTCALQDDILEGEGLHCVEVLAFGDQDELTREDLRCNKQAQREPPKDGGPSAASSANHKFRTAKAGAVDGGIALSVAPLDTTTLLAQVSFERTWRELFHGIDTNKSGSLEQANIEDLGRSLQFPLLQQLVEESDLNSDGIVTEEEWMGLLRKLREEHGDLSPAAMTEIQRFVQKGSLGALRHQERPRDDESDAACPVTDMPTKFGDLDGQDQRERAKTGKRKKKANPAATQD